MSWSKVLLAAGLAACMIALPALAAEGQKAEHVNPPQVYVPALDLELEPEYFSIRGALGIDPEILADLIQGCDLSLLALAQGAEKQKEQTRVLQESARALQESARGEMTRSTGVRYPNPEDQAKHEKKLRSMMVFGLIQRMIQEMDLSEEQTVQLLSVMLTQDKKDEDVAQKRLEATESIRAELKKDKPDQKTLQRLIAQNKDLGNQWWQARQARKEQILNLLTVEQQARYLILEPQFENHIWDTIARIRVTREGSRSTGEGGRSTGAPAQPRER